MSVQENSETVGLDRTSRAIEFGQMEQRYRTFRTLIRSAAWVGVAYFAFGAVESLAGQNTGVNVALSVALSAIASLKVVLAIALTGAAVAWAVIERALRLRKVEQMQGRIRHLENLIDPNRSSSGLTPRGKTNPEDVWR